jgi:transposase
MVKYARSHPRKYKKVYGRRNVIEAAFWSLKSLVGDYLRCRLERIRKIEVWLKVIVYNLVTVLRRTIMI